MIPHGKHGTLACLLEYFMVGQVMQFKIRVRKPLSIICAKNILLALHMQGPVNNFRGGLQDGLCYEYTWETT
jgi:hypothetical protein